VDRQALVLALAFGLFGTAYYGYIAWLADAYIERGWTAVQAGLVIAVLNVASLIGALSIAPVSRLLGYGRSLVATSAGFAVASVGFLVLPDAGFGWAALVGYSNGALLPLLLAQPVRIGRSTDEVGWLSAVMLGGGYTLAALAPVALGALRDMTGTFGPSFGALALAAIAIPVLAVTMVRSPQRA
jgi:CP family cyanate transporter-like MFS transporter